MHPSKKTCVPWDPRRVVEKYSTPGHLAGRLPTLMCVVLSEHVPLDKIRA